MWYLFSLKAVYNVKGVFLGWKLLRSWDCSLLCLFYHVIAIETIPGVNVQFNNEQFAYSLNLLCDIIKFCSLETIKYLNFWGLHQMIGLHDNGLAAVASDSIQCLWSSFRNWLIWLLCWLASLFNNSLWSACKYFKIDFDFRLNLIFLYCQELRFQSRSNSTIRVLEILYHSGWLL